MFRSTEAGATEVAVRFPGEDTLRSSRLVVHPTPDGRLVSVYGLEVSQRHLDDALFDELTALNNELANAHRALAVSKARVEDISEQKTRLLGTAAHDLRSPLTVTIMNAELLLRGGFPPEEVDEVLRDIREASTFMVTLVDGLLDLASLQSSAVTLRLERIDFVGLVRRCAHAHGLRARQKDQELQVHATAETLPAVVDGHKLQQVLNNLIGNAVKFSPPGRSIRVRIEGNSTEVVVRVQDQGPGIPAGEQNRLFRPLSRTSVRPTGQEPSTGLGLSICKNIVEAHGGRIWFESELGVGSSFFFSVPRSLVR